MYNGIIVSVILVLILFLLGLILLFLTNSLLIPILFTPRKVLKEIVDIIDPKDDEKILDLGSGDGRILFALRKRAKIEGVGYEISPIMILLSKFLMRFNLGFKSDIEFDVQSIFDVKLGSEDKIFCHLSERAMEILRKKFKKELNPGTVVYSYEYKIPDIKESMKKKLSNGKYLYTYSF